MTDQRRPILCLDFDGVIHSYESGWKGADVIPDPPVSGAVEFICEALKHFRVVIFSSRSNQPGGLGAMRAWLHAAFVNANVADRFSETEWPIDKPAAFLTIDDRALTFDGTWPPIEALKTFQPWNRKPIT